ncbi:MULTISPECIES: DUF3899 domain-containing protein [Sediminibacillus]|uniref:DUF3899 domain-containing protein n=1 Tax=Sediminibacillus TaxID=482460 RepID=UPI001297094F|nr:DUF3899 domain-containing protein [Sediminibacillus terrae]
MKRKLLIFLVSIVAWIGVKYLLSYSLLKWVNLSFSVGILLMILAAVTFILQTGFFSPLFKGFRLIGESISNKSNAMERTDSYLAQDSELQNFKQKTIQLTGYLSFLTGGGSLLASLMGLFLL